MGYKQLKQTTLLKTTYNTMESKQNHQWLCLYKDSIYKCTCDTYDVNFTKVSSDGWNYTRDAVVVNDKEALVVYKDQIYTLNL